MRKLIYKNTLGQQVEIGDAAPFILQSYDDSNNVNLYTSKGVRQDGVSYLGNTLDARDISLQIAVLARNDTDILQYKELLNRAFNPKTGEGFLVYNDGENDRKIKCIVNQLPYWKKESRGFETCLVSLTASNPFWTDVYETKEEVAIWRGSLEFPLELVAEGIELGYREPSLIVNVFNHGDVECGMRIEFKALASVENPSLLNVNTGEQFKINKTMSAGEIITVTTHFQNKRVGLNKNGVVSNAFNWIDLSSIFLQLDPGDNLLRYDADNGIDNLEVSIYYTPQYLGV